MISVPFWPICSSMGRTHSEAGVKGLVSLTFLGPETCKFCSKDKWRCRQVTRGSGSGHSWPSMWARGEKKQSKDKKVTQPGKSADTQGSPEAEQMASLWVAKIKSRPHLWRD